MDSMADWVSAICAVVSVIGAGLSWWRANLSRRARAAAEEERKLAQEARERADRTLEQLRRVADEVEGPPLTLTPHSFDLGNLLWYLKNTRRKALVITEFINSDSIQMFNLEAPCVLEPGEVVELRAPNLGVKPLPTTLNMRVEGFDDVVRASFI